MNKPPFTFPADLDKNLDLVANPDKNFVVIMKDGKICKNMIK